MTQYANPLAHAKVRAERIDQGVDYAGTGTYTALARGVITKILDPSSSGWPGWYIEYQVTDPTSPLKGQPIYYAEGVRPAAGIKVGSVVNPGDAVANLIPGWQTGTEVGFASGVGSSSYASQHGGYKEGYATIAGDAFSLLLGDLGAPQGHVEGPFMSGSTAPPGAEQLLHQRGGLGSVIGAGSPLGVAGGAIGDAAGAVGSAVSSGVDVIGALAGFVSNPIHALLTMVLVITGALLVYSGAGKMLGYERPVTSTAKVAATLAGVPATAAARGAAR